MLLSASDEQQDSEIQIRRSCGDGGEGGECDQGGMGLCRDESVPQEFGSVSIVNSNGVQIGNNIYYHGPVTVKQILAPAQNEAIGPAESLEKAEKGDKNEEVPRHRFFPKSRKWRMVSGVVVSVGLAAAIFNYLILRRLDNHPGYSDYVVLPNSTDSPHLKPNTTRIYERSVWTHRKPLRKIDTLRTPVPLVIIAHSVTSVCNTLNECSERIKAIQDNQMDVLDWEDIAYNFLIGGDGRIYEGRGWDSMGAHTYGYNRNSTGICLIGNFMKVEPPFQQIAATHKLIELGVLIGKISSDYRLLAQKQVQATESPGRRLFALMTDWPHFGFASKSTKYR